MKLSAYSENRSPPSPPDSNRPGRRFNTRFNVPRFVVFCFFRLVNLFRNFASVAIALKIFSLPTSGIRRRTILSTPVLLSIVILSYTILKSISHLRTQNDNCIGLLYRVAPVDECRPATWCLKGGGWQVPSNRTQWSYRWNSPLSLCWWFRSFTTRVLSICPYPLYNCAFLVARNLFVSIISNRTIFF